jgi:pyruvate/2-oxoglutarate dehydrogenase complex dihydrolipoamide acyltransferase (E2) component
VILEFRLPAINPYMTEAQIDALYAAPGDPVKTGSKLLDVRVDLSSAFAQDCPPISYYRVVMRENAVLREVRAAAGTTPKVGDVIAVFSSTPDEPLDQPAQRVIRVATAGIMAQGGVVPGSTG